VSEEGHGSISEPIGAGGGGDEPKGQVQFSV
jgi:hypothetical protein